MPNYNFLPFFITEPVYIIQEPISAPVVEPIALEVETPEKPVPDHKAVPYSEPAEKPKKKEVNLKTRGGFKKKVLLLVDDNHPEVLNITDTEFLIKILKAVQLSEDDVVILNVHDLNEDAFELIKERYDYRVLIMFGIESASFAKDQSKYKISDLDGKKVLLADALSDLDKDKQKKLKLWENLQLLFIMK